MKDIFNNLSGYFILYFVFALIWIIVVFSLLLWRRNKRGLVFPKRNDPNVVFYEKRVSGSSHKSRLTKLGGASNCLTIIVTDSYLAITSHFPFTALAGSYDLEHLIPISKITNVITKGKTTLIEFQRDDDKPGKFSLRLKNPSDFTQALQQQTKTANKTQHANR